MINQFDAFGISMDHSRGRLLGRVSFSLIRPPFDRIPCVWTHGDIVRVCRVWPTLTGLSGQARFESGMFNRGVSMMALSSLSPTPTVEFGHDGVPWTYHPSCLVVGLPYVGVARLTGQRGWYGLPYRPSAHGLRRFDSGGVALGDSCTAAS